MYSNLDTDVKPLQVTYLRISVLCATFPNNHIHNFAIDLVRTLGLYMMLPDTELHLDFTSSQYFQYPKLKTDEIH